MSKTILFMRRHAEATCDDAKWDERKHKRDKGGKFSSTGAGGGSAPTEQPPKTGIHKYLGMYLQRHGAKPTRPSVKELAKTLAKHTPDVRAYADGILAHEDDEHELRRVASNLGFDMKVEHRSGKSIFFSVKKR